MSAQFVGVCALILLHNWSQLPNMSVPSNFQAYELQNITKMLDPIEDELQQTYSVWVALTRFTTACSQSACRHNFQLMWKHRKTKLKTLHVHPRNWCMSILHTVMLCLWQNQGFSESLNWILHDLHAVVAGGCDRLLHCSNWHSGGGAGIRNARG